MSAFVCEPPRYAAFERLKTALAAPAPSSPSPLRATGLACLDQALEGGLPRGCLVALEGRASSGRYALAAYLLARATRNGFAAICDDGSWYPPALAQAGVDLKRLLIVPGNDPLALLRSADLLIRGGAMALVVVPPLRARPALWCRLRSLAQNHATWALALAATPLEDGLALAADVQLRAQLEAPRWSAAPAPLTQFLGYDVRIDVLRARHVRGRRSAHISAVA